MVLILTAILRKISLVVGSIDEINQPVHPGDNQPINT